MKKTLSNAFFSVALSKKKIPSSQKFLSALEKDFYLFCLFFLGVLASPQHLFAQVNQAIYVTGNEGYVEIPHNNSFNFTNNFSLEFWLRADATQADMSASYNNILVKSFNYSGAIPFGFQFINTGVDAGKLKVIRKNSTGASIANYLSINRIDDGKFHHIAFVKDSTSAPASNLKLYVDGVLQGSGIADVTGTLNNNNSLYLGRRGDVANPFSGAFDELKIWRTARTAANVVSDMTSVLPSTMLGYYNMETGLKNKGSVLSVNGYLGGDAAFFPTQKSYGNALHFDGNNDFINMASNPGTLSNQLTVDAWIRPETLSGTQTIATQAGKWELKLISGKIFFTLTTTTGTILNIYSNANLPSAEKWYHIAAVFNGNGTNNRIELYLNGEVENSIVLGQNYSIATAGTGMMIGASGSSSTPKLLFKGMMDEFNVWKTALSEDNIITDMNKGDVSANVNHLVYFPFDQGTPAGSNATTTTATNVFANGNGVLSNFALSGNTSNWVARAAYLQSPNATLVSGNNYTFEGSVLQTGTGKVLGNGFLLSNSSISAYPAYNNATVSVLQAEVDETNFEKNTTLTGGSFIYKSYVIGTDGLVISGQSTGPCVTGFPVGNITFGTGSVSLNTSWTSVVGATSYDWTLVSPNSSLTTPEQQGSSTGTSVLLKNLDPGSRYYFYLRARCGGGVGEWVGPAFFSTLSSPSLNADSLKNDAYIDIEWSLPSAYFVQNSPLGVHIQLKNGNTLLHEQSISDYTPYQGATQPTFSFVGNGNLSQYYNVTNTNTWAQMSAWTMETWVKMGATNTYSTRLFRKINGTGTFEIRVDSVDKQVKLILNNTVYAFSHSTLPVEQWFHLAVSYGNGAAQLYIDGTWAAMISLPAVQISGGNYQALYAVNQAQMAELRFWNRVRTEEEIKYNKLIPTFSGAIQNNLLVHWKWQTATSVPTDLATTYDGIANTGALFQVGGAQITSISNATYTATPYYTAIHGTYRHYTGPSAVKTYKLNGYQIGSGTIINAVYFPPQDTGKTLPYQALEWLKADSTPFNIALSWKNKSRMSEFFRIRRTDSNGLNSVTLATVSGTDKIDSVLTYNDIYSLEDSAALRSGTLYRYYVDTYSATFNSILDSLKYNVVNLPAINVTATDNLFPNKVNLSWNDLSAFGYQIRIDRDDETLATLNPTVTSYTDLYPIYGKRHRYAVILLDPASGEAVAAGFDRGGIQAKGAISGSVYSLVGQYAIKNVRIRLTNLTNEAKDSTMTDANGAFSFNQLYYGEVGNFTLSAYYPTDPSHRFVNSPRTLTLSDENYALTNVIFKDSATWTTDTTSTGFTLSNFVASPQNTQDKVNLSWNYSLSVGDTLRMNVYRDNVLIRVLNVTTGTNLSFADSLGKPGYVYDYSISAYKFQGSTVKVLNRVSENITFPAQISPTAFVATANTALGIVNLSWAHSSQNYDGFRIYRAKQTTIPSPPSDTVLIATLPKGTFAFKDKQTLYGTSAYKYVIRAYRTVENLTFESAKVSSGSVNYPTLPALSVLTATPTPNRNSVSLTWTLPTGSPLNDTTYNYDGYLVYRKKNTPANSPYELIGRVYKHFAKAFEDKTGIPNTAYTYQVKAFLLNKQPISQIDTLLVSAGIIKAATYPIIKAPLSLVLSNNVNYVNLTWSPAISQSGGARNFDGQTVYWKVGTGATDSAEIPIGQSTYTVYTNTTSATPTNFSVRSYRNIGGVKYSSTAISSNGYATGTNPSNLPLPQQFKASQNLPAHIRLSWTYPDYILAEFRIYRNGTLMTILPNDAREYYDYTAANYQNYLYEIEASYQQTTTLKASAIGKRNTLSSLMGRVYANNSLYGLPFIEVTISAQGYFARTFTDSTGFYRIDNLPTQQSLPITVSVDGGNTTFSSPNYPASKTFFIDGERFKAYTMDFVSNYSPASKDINAIASIQYVTATPDPARKQVNIAWTPSNQNYDGFYVYRANSLMGTVNKNEAFVFNDTEGTPGINYLYLVVPYINGENTALLGEPKSTNATYPSVESVVYLNANAKPLENAVELNWSHLWANHTKYQISRNGDLMAELPTSLPSTLTDTTGIPGQLYTYEVIAADSVNGAWVYSEPVTVQGTFPILTDITDFSVQIPDTILSCNASISRNHTLLQWSYPSACTGFWGYRNGERVKIFSNTETSWRDSLGTPGSASVYQVKAYLTRNNTNYSAEGLEQEVIYPAIAAPFGLTSQAVQDSGKVLLAWQYAENLINGFEIYRMSGNYGTELIKTIKLDSIVSRFFTYWDISGVMNQAYTYNVKAYSKLNGITYYSDMSPCQPAAVTYPSIPAPVATSNAVATDGTYQNYVKLSWDYLADNLDGFNIYRGNLWLDSLGKGMREYTDISNTPGVFNYQIKAYKWVKVNGNSLKVESLPLADNGNIGQATVGTVNPLLATKGTLVAKVELNWVASGTVNIYRDNVQIGTTSADTYTDNNLTPGKHYIYEVGPNSNDRKAVEGWGLEDGYVSGSVKTQGTNTALQGAIIEAKIKVGENTYYYKDTTDSNGNYAISKIYYGEGTNNLIITANLTFCGAEHTFGDNPKVQLMSSSLHSFPQVNFFDLTKYKVKGNVKRAFSSCGLDSMRIYAKYEFTNNTTTNSTAVYTDKEGNYSIEVNPIQANLVRITIMIDSMKGNYKYRFEPQQAVTWTGQDLACLDQLNTLDFEDMLTYRIKISVVNGCGNAITGGRYNVQVQSEEACYDRTFTVDQTTGILNAYLPAMPLNIRVYKVENLTAETQLVVEYLKYRPIFMKLDSLVAIVNGNINNSQWAKLTDVKLTYHKPPRIVLAQGFSKYLCNNPENAAIIQQADKYTLKFQVLETFGTDCPVKNGYIKIKNAAAQEVNTTLNYNSQGVLDDYVFTAGNPNLVKPNIYNCQVSYYNLSGELLAETNLVIIVEGTIQLPGSDVIVDVAGKKGIIPLPLYVLRDPPGDGSFSTISKGSTLKKTISLSRERSGGAGVYAVGELIGAFIGVGWESTLIAGGGNSRENTWEVSTTTTEDISTSAEDWIIGEDADIIIGAGLAMQYGLAKKIKVSGCNTTDSTIFALGPNGINTTWIYTVFHIKALIAEDSLRIVRKDRISENGKLKSVEYSKAFFQNKIDNWKKILSYHKKETLPYYNLCAIYPDDSLSDFQEEVYKKWQNGFCKLIRKNVAGAFVPKDNIVWNQDLVDKYNVAETVLKNVVKKGWETMPYDWEFSTSNLANRQHYIDEQYEAMHGIAAENITYSAGVEYTKSIESAKSSSTTFGASSLFSLDGAFGFAWKYEFLTSAAPLGLGFIFAGGGKTEGQILGKYEVNIDISESYENALENTNNIGYTLSDGDIGDQFSVTVIQGIEPNQTPYFSLLGGRSSCPDEAGTISRDFPDIKVINPENGAAASEASLYNVDPETTADFLLQFSNKSPFNETRSFFVYMANGINVGNATVEIDGQNMGQFPITLQPGQTVQSQVSFTKGSIQSDYDSIVFKIRPECQTEYFANNFPSTDPNTKIVLDFHFANPCSEIVLAEPEDNWVIQRRNFTSNVNQEALPIKVAGFDVESNDFKRIYFQYRRIGVQNDWQLVPNSFVNKDDLAEFVAANVFPNETPYYWFIWDITDDFERYPNGDYELRVVAECQTNGKTVLSYSNRTTGVIDRNQQLIGLPEPADKMWTYGDEISISFVSDIACNLIDSSNFVVRNLNDLVNGVYSVVPGKVYCHNNKLSFIPNADMRTFDGDTLQFTVSGVYDVTGQLLNDETWSFGVYARDLYMDNTKFDIQLYQGDETTLISHFYNKKTIGSLTFDILGVNSVNGTYSNWFTARPPQGTITPGANKAVYFDISAANLDVGFYTVTFNVQDQSVPFTMYEKALTFNLEVLPKPTNWTVNPANFEHSMTVNANYHFTNPSTTNNTDTTDFISVWIENELRGVAKIEKIGTYYAAIINVYGNDADAGKALSFRVWDTSTGTEYDAFSTTPRTYLKDANIGSIISPLILNVNQVEDKVRYMYFNQGWNLFSFNSNKANDSLNKVLSSLHYLQNGEVIKTAIKAAIFNGTTWVTANGLYTTDIYHGYQMYLNHDDTLRITGTLSTTLSKDSLFSGWNLIAAPVTVPTSLETLLSASNFLSTAQPDSMILKTRNLPIESQYQNMVAYYKATQTPKWLYSNASGMESIRPNHGYWLRVNKKTNLCMSTTSCGGTITLRTGTNVVQPFDAFDRETWQVNPSDYEFNMLITGYIELDDELLIQENSKVAAYIGKECRGLGELVYVPELKRYLLSMFVYANESEEISFRIYNPQNDRYYTHFEDVIFESDKLIGALETPYRFSNLAPDNAFSAAAYPNPFQHKLNVDIVSDIEQDYIINLTDMMGRVIESTSLNETGTNHHIEIKTSDLKFVEGVYLLHIKGSKGEQKAVKVVYNP